LALGAGRAADAAGVAPFLKVARVKPDMILDETRNEEIAVIVAGLHPQIERDTTVDARRSQQIRLELDFQELILFIEELPW